MLEKLLTFLLHGSPTLTDIDRLLTYAGLQIPTAQQSQKARQNEAFN